MANLNLMKKCVRIKIFRGIVMPSEKDKILEFKSDKMPYSTIKPAIDRCGKNPEHFLWIFNIRNLRI